MQKDTNKLNDRVPNIAEGTVVGAPKPRDVVHNKVYIDDA